MTHSYFGLIAAMLPPNRSHGPRMVVRVFVTSVVPGGAAAGAGLRAGDVITAIDGQTATCTQDRAAITLSEKPGETVKRVYIRDGRSQTATRGG